MTICSGCEHPMSEHIHNVEGDVICLHSWYMYGVRRCDCVNGVSECTNAYRREQERKRKETEAYIDSLIQRVEDNPNDR
jgi:hypothetical protein